MAIACRAVLHCLFTLACQMYQSHTGFDCPDNRPMASLLESWDGQKLSLRTSSRRQPLPDRLPGARVLLHAGRRAAQLLPQDPATAHAGGRHCALVRGAALCMQCEGVTCVCLLLSETPVCHIVWFWGT